MKEIIFSDIDGTLLNSQHKITPLTRQAIIKLSIKNIPFVLVSARGPMAIRPIYEEYHIQCPMIAYSGALILDQSGHMLFHKGMSCNKAIEVIQYIESQQWDVTWNLYSFENWYVKNRNDERIKNEENIVKVQSQKIDTRKIFEIPVIHKILCMCQPHEIDAIEKKLKEKFKDLSIVRSSDKLIEIMACHVNKAQAIIKLCQYWQLDMQNAIAFGDQYNDLEMLKLVGKGYVMENGSVEVKQAIGCITSDNDHDGIAVALNDLGIIS